DLADKHAIDSRALINSGFYRDIFPTRLSPEKRAVADFLTTARGCRKATSIGGVLTGRGADFIIIDDPLQPDKALSDTRRNNVNDWYDNTLCSRLNHKLTGCIILIMQRLHEDDLVGHVLDIERRQGYEGGSPRIAGGGEGGSPCIHAAGAAVGGSPRIHAGGAGLQSSGGGAPPPELGFSPGLPSAKAPIEEDAFSRGAEAPLPSAESRGLPPNNVPPSSSRGLPPTKWNVLSFPAIAEKDETYEVERWSGETITYHRRAGEALHPEREPLEILEQLRETQGEYNFAGQYQQSPAPLGGGMVKQKWFKTYTESDRPEQFDFTFQSWDTANKATELSDYSVCTTWGVSANQGSDRVPGTGSRGGRLYLLNVFRRRMEYPELKREVRAQAAEYGAKNVLIEDKASGTQLAQELIQEGLYGVTRCQSTMEKTMRLHTVTSIIENGFVYLPEQAHWLAQYIHELVTFPNGKHDDQADSTSQALNWIKSRLFEPPILVYYREQALKLRNGLR
ncbi:MAG: phage terminase large subunit, partial [Terriglobales bacterium]